MRGTQVLTPRKSFGSACASRRSETLKRRCRDQFAAERRAADDGGTLPPALVSKTTPEELAALKRAGVVPPNAPACDLVDVVYAREAVLSVIDAGASAEARTSTSEAEEAAERRRLAHGVAMVLYAGPRALPAFLPSGGGGLDDGGEGASGDGADDDDDGAWADGTRAAAAA